METMTQNIDQSTILLQAKHISHSFDYPLFNNIDLTLNKKESIAIIGASGSGKSTFLNILSSLLTPNDGLVTYKNKNIYELNDNEILKIRRDEFGIIFQSHYLFRGFNARENLEIASILSDEDINNKLLNDLNIDFVMEQNIGELSGGQQQRLSIARVLTKKPKVIFADEPTGNLDKETAKIVMDNLFKYIKDESSALIIVTHEDDIAFECDHVYKFESNTLKKLK